MALWQRGRHDDLEGLVDHSDRGGQYLSIRYTERLAEAAGVRSVGSQSDAYDNAVAESVHSLYKAELINRRGPWRGAVASRDGDRRVGGLVEPPAPAQRGRQPAAGGV